MTCRALSGCIARTGLASQRLMSFTVKVKLRKETGLSAVVYAAILATRNFNRRNNMLNKVILIGNLGVDPESRFMPSGGQVVSLRLATTRRWKDKQNGERKEETEWHRVVFFNRLAEIAAEYLKKGSQIYVEGRIRTQKWQDKDGSDRFTTEIVAEEMHMLGGKTASKPEKEEAPAQSMDYDFDDDKIPF